MAAPGDARVGLIGTGPALQITPMGWYELKSVAVAVANQPQTLALVSLWGGIAVQRDSKRVCA